MASTEDIENAISMVKGMIDGNPDDEIGSYWMSVLETLQSLKDVGLHDD